MKETSKTRSLLTEEERKLLEGSVLDIGAGMDPITPTAVRFDLEHGDANRITAFPPGSFDCVYSSHCLEHMFDPPATLQNWWSLVRPGGHLFLIVPDEDLYEQGVFPSRFNFDHKHTFTIGKKSSWSPKSHNLYALCAALPGAEIRSVLMNDAGYDRSIQGHGALPGVAAKVFRRIGRIYRRLRENGLMFRSRAIEGLVARNGGWDQTRDDALAQIECVVRKSATAAV